MDNVNSPKHYTQGGIETIDYIKAKMTPEQYKGYLLGNVIKYTSRFQEKNGAEDLSKANWYLARLHKVERDEVSTPTFNMPIKPKKGINELCNDAFTNAVKKGWHDVHEPRSFGEVIALIHSELSEALEDYRSGAEINETWYEDGKPCGIPSELADVCIRIFDYCGSEGIDLEGMINEKMAYNATRPARHGGKKL